MVDGKCLTSNKINMNIHHRKHLIKIECTRSNKNDFESFYDFKFKNQDLLKCRYVNNIRILTEEQLNLDDFGNIIINLKKLKTIEKHFSFNSKDFGCPIFTKSNL